MIKARPAMLYAKPERAPICFVFSVSVIIVIIVSGSAGPARSAAFVFISPDQLDYGMENGEVVYKCRQALLFYTLRTLRLSPDDVESDNNQIVLKNKNEIFVLLNM